MKKKSKQLDPVTDREFIDALEKLGYRVSDTGNGFVVRSNHGGKTKLEADDYYGALFEAWHLMKP